MGKKKRGGNGPAWCQGKIAYDSAPKAFRTVLKQRKRGYAVRAYRCSLCAQWHVGRIERKPAPIKLQVDLDKDATFDLSKFGENNG